MTKDKTSQPEKASCLTAPANRPSRPLRASFLGTGFLGAIVLSASVFGAGVFGAGVLGAGVLGAVPAAHAAGLAPWRGVPAVDIKTTGDLNPVHSSRKRHHRSSHRRREHRRRHNRTRYYRNYGTTFNRSRWGYDNGYNSSESFYRGGRWQHCPQCGNY